MRAMHSQLMRKQVREIKKQCKAMQTERCTQNCMSCMHNECTATVDALFHVQTTSAKKIQGSDEVSPLSEVACSVCLQRYSMDFSAPIA